jgi:hypothetical protein
VQVHSARDAVDLVSGERDVVKGQRIRASTEQIEAMRAGGDSWSDRRAAEAMAHPAGPRGAALVQGAWCWLPDKDQRGAAGVRAGTAAGGTGRVVRILPAHAVDTDRAEGRGCRTAWQLPHAHGICP